MNSSLQRTLLVSNLLTEFYLQEQCYYDDWPCKSYSTMETHQPYIEYIEYIEDVSMTAKQYVKF